MELYGESSDYRTQKVLIASKYASLNIHLNSKDLASVFACHPPAKSPMLKGPEGYIFQSNAILRYIANLKEDAHLYGSNVMEMAHVDQWLDFSWNEIELAAAILTEKEKYSKSTLNYKECEMSSKAEIDRALKILDNHLQDKAYLVGERITIADISIICGLFKLFTTTLTEDQIAKNKNFATYFSTLTEQDDFKSVLGVSTSKSSCDNVLEKYSATSAPGTILSTPLIKEKYDRRRVRVKELLRAGLELEGKSITVKGWAKTLREAGAGSFAFLEINDGSCFSGVQVILNKGETEGFELAMESGGVGASFSIEGIVVKSPAKGQLIELKATTVKVLGRVEDKATYPMSKKRHTLEHLRTNAHLRPRSNIHGAAMRLRNSMVFATHKFYNERGFLNIHTPLITPSDCEGAGEMFSVTTLLSKHPDGQLPLTEDKKRIDYSNDFFGRPSFLTVSGQLNVETHCLGLSDVYTFGPTFRAENSNTTRHLAEFWMIEPEIAFGDLEDDMNLAEDYLKYCAQYALENCMEDLEFFEKAVEKGLVQRLKSTVESDFVRVSYTEAVEYLTQDKVLKKAKFQVKPQWGDDLGSEHERYLTEKVYKKPVIIYNYPKDIKAFYMRLNDDNKTVAACDILVPQIGEIIGGSQREERLDVLEKRIIERTGHDPAEYGWYNDLRKYGSIPHSGFGLGFERLIRFVTGIENIRDVIPFPRWPGNANF